MGKASMCIQMLELLNTGRVYKKSELAELLNTNPRNLIEYKKELEEAGYEIESIPGNYGGYRLLKSNVIPAIYLNPTNGEMQWGIIEILRSFPEKSIISLAKPMIKDVRQGLS